MKNKIDHLRKLRKSLLDSVNNLTVEQLNEIPGGFNNNIIWNLAHLVASQQGVCYLRAGHRLFVEENYYLSYKPGTKPEKYIESEEVEMIKKLLISTIDQFEKDHRDNLFENYASWTTSYGTELSGIDDAVEFLLFHEGHHTGYIMALKHCCSR